MLLNQRVLLICRWVLLTAILALGSSCSSDGEDPQGVIPEGQLQAMEKARAVEDALQKQHEELRKKLDEE